MVDDQEFKSDWNPASIVIQIIGYQMVDFDVADRKRDIRLMYESLRRLYDYARPAMGTKKAKTIADAFEKHFMAVEELVYHSENSFAQHKRTVAWKRRYHDRMNKAYQLLTKLRPQVFELLQAVGLYLPVKHLDDDKLNPLDRILRDEYGIQTEVES